MTNVTEAPAADASAGTLPVLSHWIDGAIRESHSGRTAPVFNPATGAQRVIMPGRITATQ